jgi:long-chain acyl-CoA synthetase
MSTLDDVRAALTGPGGPFEVTTEVVGGHELKVYKDRFPDLRVVAGFGLAHGDKEFLVHGERRITFGEFTRLANSVSAGLAAVGVVHGDRVAVLSQNNPEWCLTFWGTVNLGAVLVGLNGWWNEDEIVYGLEDSGARVLVADRKRFERVAADVDRITSLEHVYLVDADPAEFPGPDGTPSPKLHRFDELTASPTDAVPDTALHEDDPAVIFYTSGTTGRPKGAISTHRNMVANLQNTVFLLTLGSMTAPADDDPTPGAGAGQPVALFTSPLFHVSGCHSGLVVGMLPGMMIGPRMSTSPVSCGPRCSSGVRSSCRATGTSPRRRPTR